MLMRARKTPRSSICGLRAACSNSTSMRRVPMNLTRRIVTTFLRMTEKGGLARLVSISR